MYLYFVHFTFVNKTLNNGDGNIDVMLEKAIDGIDSVRHLEDGMKDKYGFSSIVITNFILLDDNASVPGKLEAS